MRTSDTVEFEKMPAAAETFTTNGYFGAGNRKHARRSLRSSRAPDRRLPRRVPESALGGFGVRGPRDTAVVGGIEKMAAELASPAVGLLYCVAPPSHIAIGS